MPRSGSRMSGNVVRLGRRECLRSKVRRRRAVGVELGQQALEPDLVESADHAAALLRVAYALGEGERRGHEVQRGEREKGANPAVDRQVQLADDDAEQGLTERDRGLSIKRGGVLGRPWSCHTDSLV